MGKELIKIEMERENLQQKWGITVQAQTHILYCPYLNNLFFYHAVCDEQFPYPNAVCESEKKYLKNFKNFFLVRQI
jgi:hypothetical protein